MDTGKTLLTVWMVLMTVTAIAVLSGIAFMRDGIRYPARDPRGKKP